MDQTPYWLIAIFIIVTLVVLFGAEMIKQSKAPESTHYDIRMLFGKDKQ